MRGRRENPRSIARGFRALSSLHRAPVTSGVAGCGTCLAPADGMSHPRRALVVLAALLLLAGCARSTRMARMGPLSPMEPLVTLVVSDDRRVVERECRDVPAVGPVLGCSMWRTVRMDGGTDVKVMKVVRYADSLPSELALEIDVHELCHVVAALQSIDDPCHVGNNGVIQSAAGVAPVPRTR